MTLHECLPERVYLIPVEFQEGVDAFRFYTHEFPRGLLENDNESANPRPAPEIPDLASMRTLCGSR